MVPLPVDAARTRLGFLPALGVEHGSASAAPAKRSDALRYHGTSRLSTRTSLHTLYTRPTSLVGLNACVGRVGYLLTALSWKG